MECESLIKEVTGIWALELLVCVLRSVFPNE